MINWLLKILALLGIPVLPGYSRDGPPCVIDRVFRYLYKPVAATDAHGLGLCLL